MLLTRVGNSQPLKERIKKRPSFQNARYVENNDRWAKFRNQEILGVVYTTDIMFNGISREFITFTERRQLHELHYQSILFSCARI
jgi:hypothetical protein